jgi:ankyrin repeat protein
MKEHRKEGSMKRLFYFNILLVFWVVCACSHSVFYYSKYGDIDGVKPFVEKGDIHRANSYGFTPLLIATYYGHTGLVKYLAENGADVNRQDNRGWTSLMYAAYYNHKDIAKILLEHNASVTIKNSEGKTALDYAEEANSGNLLDLLKKERT